PASSVSVKLYGTYALSYFFLDQYNTISDFSSLSMSIPSLGSLPGYNNKGTAPYTTSGNLDYSNFAYPLIKGNRSFKNVSAGITVSPLKTGLSFNYFFQQGAYLSPIFITIPAYANSSAVILEYNNTNAYLHRFGVDYKLNGAALNWQTGLNATMLEQQYPVYQYLGKDPTIGANEWTGGWVNRLAYCDFFAGADVFYHFGETIYTSDPVAAKITSTRINSISLQNVYAGYKFKVIGLKGLEVFANGRNLIQSQN